MAGALAPRLAGLDGLRALAVGAVVVYHLDIDWLPGGFLGVDMFFVISGFLITSILLEELARTRRINIVQFYVRRIRRLFPALVGVLLGIIVLVSTVAPDSAHAVARDAPAALVYVSNWWAISQQQSYFEIIGRGNLLGHLWSLAIEEQFYVVWPTVLMCGWWICRGRFVSTRVYVAAVGVSGALLSTAWMWHLADTAGYLLDADPSRVYFGTDTHAMSILSGVALAALWRPRSIGPLHLKTAKVLVGVLGALGLSLVWWLCTTWNEYEESLYRGGFLVVSVIMVIVVWAVTYPGSWFGRIVDGRPLRWIGERSYGIYLWHFPLFLVTRPGLDFEADGVAINLTRIGLVVLVSAASYRWLEKPIRNGAVGELMAQLKLHAAPRMTLTSLAAASVAGLALGNAFLQASLIPPSVFAVERNAPSAVAREIERTSTTDTTPPPTVTPPSPTPTSTVVAKPRVKGAQVSWYGDSVSLWAQSAIAEILPRFYLNARLNQSPGSMMRLALDAKKQGTLRAYVVLHMGTGGPISESSLRDALKKLRDRTRVVLINSTARFSYVKPNNRLLAEVATDFPNVVVADWYSYSHGHTDWFKDGLHCSAKGKPIFAKFVNSVLNRPAS